MSARFTTLYHDYRDDNDVERTAELRCIVTDPIPATQLEPRDPGEIDPRELRIDGELVTDHSGYDWLIDEIVASEGEHP